MAARASLALITSLGLAVLAARPAIGTAGQGWPPWFGPRPAPHHRSVPRRPPGPDYCAPFRHAGRAPLGHARWALPPRMALKPRATYYVTIRVDAGKGTPPVAFTIKLASSVAPRTANSFLFLACNGYYAGGKFDRAIAGRLLEGGAQRSGPGYAFAPEPAPRAYARGVVAMVDDGSPRDGGRFFVLLDRLIVPARYTLLGTVSGGLGALDRLSRVPVMQQPDAREISLPRTPPRLDAISPRVVAP